MAVKIVLEDHRQFSNFKQNSDYRKILEHVTHDQAEAYIAIIKENYPELLGPQNLEALRINDLVGNPELMDFPGLKHISPTTIRYIKVASDLKNLFGDNIGKDIAGIGCGYGGQMLILDQLYQFERYTMFDLPLVLQLIERYLECHTLQGSYQTSSLNRYSSKKLDLVISNYAFSELPVPMQTVYVDKVLSHAKRGYLTMNTGMGDHGGSASSNLSIEQLKEMLPDFEILEEKPLTAPNNYIIAWGH